MALNEFGIMVAEEWERSPPIRQNIELYAWVVMPNHVHGIVKITDTVGSPYHIALLIRKSCKQLLKPTT